MKADLGARIAACRLCSPRFEVTKTAHMPRPIVWFQRGAKILIAGQAPGMRVYNSGKPFDDASGARLRNWLGMDEATFYDRTRVAIVPMAFCFPGYNAKGSDLPPPKICEQTWHDEVMDVLSDVMLTIVIGSYAQAYHIGAHAGVTQTVSAWRDYVPERFALPHPSWRNTAWLKKNPWFEAELVPELQARVEHVLND